ncbi:MAG TPA: ATP synthase F1 subunit delta [Blastocatellia bacterium]|nr:ATP synthase F1 subunit delta [Blastocatellia bacterium]
MSVIAMARRYAEALADVAIARNQVEQIDGDLLVFAEMMKSSRDLHNTFASPILSQSDKLKVLEALTARATTGKLTANLLRTMLNHYRLHHVAEVYEQFRREMNERKGLIVAEVTTATEVGPSEQTKLGRTLEQMTGKRVEFRFKTDPSLIGGVVTRIGSVVYDGSVRTQLQEIKERLKQGETGI